MEHHAGGPRDDEGRQPSMPPPSSAVPSAVPSGVTSAVPSAVASAVPSGVASAVPVVLDLGGRHAASVRRWVEGVLGWQPVDEVTASLVPPAVRFVDRPSDGTGRPRPNLPTVLVVDDDASAAIAAGLVHQERPDLVVAWPSGRDRLAVEVGLLLERPRDTTDALRTLWIGGAAGGVGTTTVTLALTGLFGWTGSATIALLRPPAPVPDLRVVTADAVGAADLWSRADLLPGVPGARVLGVVGDGRTLPQDARIDVAVSDAGVDDDVDVLVCRPDAAGLARLASTTAAAVVVVGDGPVAVAELKRAAGGRRGVWLPWSTRVARAGLHARVPGSLPGRWLRRLEPLTRASPARSHQVARLTSVPESVPAR